VKAIGHPVRTTILGLLHERAATVSELATALERPKSTVAHHVKVLAEAGWCRS
jgi:DNA-binding transcriptional ArsR family regulator